MSEYNTRPDKTLAAVCGLFCPSCTIYIASHSDPERLENLAERFGLPPEELMCDGCRSERRIYFCREHCKMTKCAAERGIDFCGQCEEFPCDELSEFQSKMPHRIELWNSHSRINEAGWETWYGEMLKEYSCGCGTINSAYDFECRKCGTEPSCAYVKKHRDEIEKGTDRLKQK